MDLGGGFIWRLVRIKVIDRVWLRILWLFLVDDLWWREFMVSFSVVNRSVELLLVVNLGGNFLVKLFYVFMSFVICWFLGVLNRSFEDFDFVLMYVLLFCLWIYYCFFVLSFIEFWERLLFVLWLVFKY